MKNKENLDNLTNLDRNIDSDYRRTKGEFYTPIIWVNEAHNMISKNLGKDWRNNYIVWDCSSGTNNLTRDFYFKNLYCSTINQYDIDMTYDLNREAIKFQYDFLNDDINKDGFFNSDNLKLPQTLHQELLNNKPILFFINPPYSTASNGKLINQNYRKDSTNTKINNIMKNRNVGASSQQLYAQFLYRILLIKKEFNLSNIKIAIFSPSLFLTGSSYKGFRKEFLKEFSYVEGFLFNAKYFSDVKSNWAISFSLWVSGENLDNIFKYTVKEINKNKEIIDIQNKILYNTDNKNSCSNWIKNRKGSNPYTSISLKSGINIGKKEVILDKKDLGYLVNDSNNIYANSQGVYIISSKITRHIKTTPIIEDNLLDCTSLFTARKLIKSNWINQKDEYLIPDKSNILYNEWEADSLIYSLFNNSSLQSSLRNINYNNNFYNIKNEMFFMSKKDIEMLALKHNNKNILKDLEKEYDRFVYKKLKDLQLSKESYEVLNKAIDLIEMSFEYRNRFDIEKPEFQINCWDCGWYQIKNLIKTIDVNELKNFNDIYKKLENKLQPQVYLLGFLIK